MYDYIKSKDILMYVVILIRMKKFQISSGVIFLSILYNIIEMDNHVVDAAYNDKFELNILFFEYSQTTGML